MSDDLMRTDGLLITSCISISSSSSVHC